MRILGLVLLTLACAHPPPVEQPHRPRRALVVVPEPEEEPFLVVQGWTVSEPERLKDNVYARRRIKGTHGFFIHMGTSKEWTDSDGGVDRHFSTSVSCGVNWVRGADGCSADGEDSCDTVRNGRESEADGSYEQRFKCGETAYPCGMVIQCRCIAPPDGGAKSPDGGL